MRIKKKENKIKNISYEECPAKTFYANNGVINIGRGVYEHCIIVGSVAKEIAIRKLIHAPNGFEILSSLHDIGKVSPYFYEKLRRASPESGLQAFANVDPRLETKWGGHAGVGMIAAKALGVKGYGAAIIGQHHGSYPQGCAGLTSEAEVFGGAEWQRERGALVKAIRAHFAGHEPDIFDYSQSRLLAGLTTVADWIGSGEAFEDPSVPWHDKIKPAVDRAGLMIPKVHKTLSFQDVFGFDPNAMQREFIDQVSAPGSYILEAPMGLGKTEAALFAAYNLLQRGQANGIYFALPTQLTSNKIYHRFGPFLQRILDDLSTQKALLLHGGAWLVESEMGEETHPGGSWFHHRKRGLLAPFAVGTLDQALMAVMNVRHGAVRAFGLAGKVVILDEVHSYDAYTGSLLDILIAELRKWGATVLLLSATLSQARRGEMVGADVHRIDYPLITARVEDASVQEIPVSHADQATVEVVHCSDASLAINQALACAEVGQQVLWVENTVAQAQDRFLSLAALARPMGIACGLLHSRYLAADRQEIENEWVGLFGKDGRRHRHKQGRILVGTQIVEQSLDIDADFLVSAFAPTDMLLQRFGRLWRHGDTLRASSARRAMWLIVPDLVSAIEQPQAAFGPTASVYSPYVLCRSLEVWQGVTSVCLPRDIRPLIEQTYSVRPEQGAMGRWLIELDQGTRYRKGRQALRQLARLTLAEGEQALPDTPALTRFSEMETVDVLLLRSLVRRPGEKNSIIELLDGRRLEIPLLQAALSRRGWRCLAASLMGALVSIPIQNAPKCESVKVLRDYGLHNCFYLGDLTEDTAALRVALVDETGQLRALHGGTPHDSAGLSYDRDFGYRIRK
jgi:CRISPR-associated endonuclease/helicase Cas3